MKKLLLLVFVACTFTQCIDNEINDTEKDIAQIRQNIKDFSSYVNTSNYEMIGASYTEDAKIFPQRGKMIAGRTNIVKYWTLPEGIKTINHKITPSEITIVDDTAYDYGHYEGTTVKSDGEESSWKGKYVIVWKRVNGNWKMYLDIWNSI
ncbi:YybH family protein [Kordia sp.]|uniref:YybH family protein n=1 Tax=Kordia sp. TaxID=1965332 RepID=UPI003D29653E